MASTATRSDSGDAESKRPGVVVLTALGVEFEAVRSMLSSIRRVRHAHGTVYETGNFGPWTVAVVETGAGDARASLETERAIQQFSPELVVFLGVAGGRKDVAVGDVVIASRVYGYESGKDGESFLPRPDVGEPSYALVQAGRAIARDVSRESLGFKVLVKPIAAGQKVVASASSRTAKFIDEHYGDAAAVEMEGRGFLLAASARSGVGFAVVRGISDLLDGKAAADAGGGQELASKNAVHVLGRLLEEVAGPAEAEDELWEHVMLHQRLSVAIDGAFEQRRDLELGLARTHRHSPPRDEEVLELFRVGTARVGSWLGVVARLLGENLPKALGGDGRPGDVRELDYVARTVGRMYADFLDWGHEWLALGGSDKWRSVVEHQVKAALSFAGDVERFQGDLARAIQVGREHDGRTPLELKVTLELRGDGLADVADLVEAALGRSP